MEDIEYLKKQITTIVNLYNTKRFLDVIHKGKVLLKKYPNQIILYNAVSLSLSAIEKHSEALDMLKKALSVQPNNIFVLNNLGLINSKLNNNNIARDYYEKALSINKDFIDALVNLGNLELADNKTDNSAIHLRNALKLSKSKQTDELIYMALGNYNQQIGNFEEAMNNFISVNKLNPNNTAADKSISLIHKYESKDDKHLLSMEAKLNLNLNDESFQRLYFALGKAYEDIKNYKKSFEYLSAGNKIADNEFKYNISDDITFFSQIKNLFENYKDGLNVPSSKEIIFILGMPRSGTTLAEQIISSHKDVYGAGELNFLTEAINMNLLEDKKFSNSLETLTHEKLIKTQSHYLDKIKSFNHKERYITDKAPLNFKWIGFIKILFPNSKIIHCERNPMDVCYSNFKNSFQSYSLSFCYNIYKLGTFYNLYKDLMTFWNEKFPTSIYNLSYEKLINNQKSTTENLLKFCNLNWDENCLSPQKNKKNVATASLAQVRSPIYGSSINKWEKFSENLDDLRKIILKD